MESCVYLDAFEHKVAAYELTVAKAHADAMKIVSEGGVVFIGGYKETGPLTVPLGEFEEDYYEDKRMWPIWDKYDKKIKKVYLTEKLNSIKSNTRFFDDGVINGSQVETECYTDEIRAYAAEFNRTMFKELMKKM